MPGVLPVVFCGHWAGTCLAGGNKPLGLPLRDVLMCDDLLACVLLQCGFSAFEQGGDGLPLSHHSFQLGLFFVQCGLGGCHIQRLVGGNRGVFCGTAQWACLAGLQCVAVLVQALNAALLRQ